MPEPVVSVIIPCYKLAHYLPQALDSVVAQTYPHLDVVIVDDGSPDDVAQAVAPYLADNRFRLVRQENAGVAAARNRGVAESHGSYLQFLDADDWLHPEKIARQVDILEADPCVGLVYCDFFTVVNGSEITELYSASDVPGPLDPDIFDTLWVRNCITYMSVLLRRDVFERAGGFMSSNMTEDYELWLRLSALGCRVRYMPERLAYYRTLENSRSRDGRAVARHMAARTEIARRFPEHVGAAAEHVAQLLTRSDMEHKDEVADLRRQVARCDETASLQRARIAELEAERDQRQARLDWLEQQYSGLAQRVQIIERSRLFQLLRVTRRHLRRLTHVRQPPASSQGH